MQTKDAIATTEHILKLRNYPRRSAYLLAALEDVAAELGEVPEDAKQLLLDHFGLASIPAEIAEALHHRHGDPARTVVVCAGPICVQAGSDGIAAGLCEEKRITVERQHCMGGCGCAPCARIGEALIAPATVEKIRSALP